MLNVWMLLIVIGLIISALYLHSLKIMKRNEAAERQTNKTIRPASHPISVNASHTPAKRQISGNVNQGGASNLSRQREAETQPDLTGREQIPSYGIHDSYWGGSGDSPSSCHSSTSYPSSSSSDSSSSSSCGD